MAKNEVIWKRQRSEHSLTCISLLPATFFTICHVASSLPQGHQLLLTAFDSLRVSRYAASSSFKRLDNRQADHKPGQITCVDASIRLPVSSPPWCKM